MVNTDVSGGRLSNLVHFVHIIFDIRPVPNRPNGHILNLILDREPKSLPTHAAVDYMYTHYCVSVWVTVVLNALIGRWAPSTHTHTCG